MSSRPHERSGRGWAGEKHTKRMMVGSRDANAPTAKVGVVAPVPINTPSLRQEIHGAQGDNAGIASLGRSSAGGGWGSGTLHGVGNSAEEAKAKNQSGRGQREQRVNKGDDVFTRHFPDLRAGLEQAEKLDAVSKAASKVAPLRKPKPDPTRDQELSLRPKAILKPSGSAGGGSNTKAMSHATATDTESMRPAPNASRQAGRRQNDPTFAEEISSKTRWHGKSSSPEPGSKGQAKRGGQRRGGAARVWDANRGKDAEREWGNGKGHSFDRERGGHDDGFKERDRRGNVWGSERRGRESNFGSGEHSASSHNDRDGTSSSKGLTMTYVRQHGPPPRKPLGISTRNQESAKDQSEPAGSQERHASANTQQPLRSSAYGPSKRVESSCEDTEKGVQRTEDNVLFLSEKSRSPGQVDHRTEHVYSSSEGFRDGGIEQVEIPEAVSAFREECHNNEDGSKKVTVGPDRVKRSVDNDRGTSGRLGGPWGRCDEGHGSTGKDLIGTMERAGSGRWKEPALVTDPAPPPPTNSRWKEPQADLRAPARTGARRWKGTDRGADQTASDRWTRDAAEPAAESSPELKPRTSRQGTENPEGSLILKRNKEETVVTTDPMSTSRSPTVQDEAHVRQDLDELSQPPALSDGVTDARDNVDKPNDGGSPKITTPFKNTFEPQSDAVEQSVLHAASWEPQLPRGTDLSWTATGLKHDVEDDNRGSRQAGSTPSTSQTWSDPWGTPDFGLSSSREQGTSAIASLLANDHGEARKDRYLPPALRSPPTASDNVESSNANENTESISSSLSPAVSAPADSPSPDVLISGAASMIGSSTSGAITGAAPMYQEQAARADEHHLHQQHVVHQQTKNHDPQLLHVHEQHGILDQACRPASGVPMAPFHHQHEQVVHQQYRPDAFHHQPFPAPEEAGKCLVENLQQHHVRQYSVQIPHFGPSQHAHVQMRLHPGPQHEQVCHQPSLEQSQQHGVAQGHRDLSPPHPVQMSTAFHSQQRHVQPQQQHHQRPHVGQPMSQQQQMHPTMPHPSSFVMGSPTSGIGFSPPGGGPGGGISTNLGGLPRVQGQFNDTLPQPYPTGMPPPGSYDFHFQDGSRKR